MPTYKLKLAFAKEDLQELLGGQYKVVVAKPTQRALEGREPTVAWQAFHPMESNTITWEEPYGIYTSYAEIKPGVELEQMSQTDFPAADGKKYELSSAGYFGTPVGDGEAGSYYAINHYRERPRLTMGLTQDAIVNGESVEGHAISAATVLAGHTAQMTPHTKVSVWVQADVSSNTVVTHIASEPAGMDFGGSVTEHSYSYDLLSGTFISA